MTSGHSVAHGCLLLFRRIGYKLLFVRVREEKRNQGLLSLSHLPLILLSLLSSVGAKRGGESGHKEMKRDKDGGMDIVSPIRREKQQISNTLD